MSKSPSPSQVIKIPEFLGSLSTRAVYIYLPPGYEEAPDKAYPILYMHDGQNCFARHEQDSYAGSWHADKTADRLIKQEKIQPCIIVGVSNGQQDRLAEYMPPYVEYKPYQGRNTKGKKSSIAGCSDKTLAYYRDEIDPYVRTQYRVLDGRENIATCGSSMGGLFSAYIALEESNFARNHAIMSPSFWITHRHDQDGSGSYAMIERFRRSHSPDACELPEQSQDLRLWLDCGSWGGSEGEGDDGLPLLLAARDALIESGFEEGENFQMYIDQGAIHHEAAWAGRFNKVLRFLFPI